MPFCLRHAKSCVLLGALLGACSSTSTPDTPTPSDGATSDAIVATDTSSASQDASEASTSDVRAGDDETTSDACTEPSCAGLAVWSESSTGFDFVETGGLTARDWEFDYVVATKMLNANTRGGGVSFQSRSVLSDADAQEILALLFTLRTVDTASCLIDGTSFVVTVSGPAGARIYHDGANSGCGGTAAKPPPWIGFGLDELSSLLYRLAARAADGGRD